MESKKFLTMLDVRRSIYFFLCKILAYFKLYEVYTKTIQVKGIQSSSYDRLEMICLYNTQQFASPFNYFREIVLIWDNYMRNKKVL